MNQTPLERQRGLDQQQELVAIPGVTAPLKLDQHSGIQLEHHVSDYLSKLR